MKKRILRVTSLVLIALFLLPFIVSCNGRPLAQTSLAGKEVGTIGKYSVQYEELYYLASNYHNAYKSKYANDPEGDVGDCVIECYAKARSLKAWSPTLLEYFDEMGG